VAFLEAWLFFSHQSCL